MFNNLLMKLKKHPRKEVKELEKTDIEGVAVIAVTTAMEDKKLTKIKYIFDLYNRPENYHHLKQSIISCNFAMADGNNDPYIIISCFLRNIGYVVDGNIYRNKKYNVYDIGAEFLKTYEFNETIYNILKNTLPVKKYLINKYPNYVNNLSKNIIMMLNKDDIKMKRIEITKFETDKLFFKYLIFEKYDNEYANDIDVPDNLNVAYFLKYYIDNFYV